MHYIGLTGIEIFNQIGRPILHSKSISYTIKACPSSVNEIPDMQKDIRTPDKVFNGINDTLDDRNM